MESSLGRMIGKTLRTLQKLTLLGCRLKICLSMVFLLTTLLHESFIVWIPKSFSAAINWLKTISQRSDGELIAIDCKVLRDSYDRDDRQSTIHMASAFASANGLVIGKIKIDAKSNEITAILALVKLLYINGFWFLLML